MKTANITNILHLSDAPMETVLQYAMFEVHVMSYEYYSNKYECACKIYSVAKL